nr:MAG TPA: hypothetical protein [Caudoviricetes sp.]
MHFKCTFPLILFCCRSGYNSKANFIRISITSYNMLIVCCNKCITTYLHNITDNRFFTFILCYSNKCLSITSIIKIR